MYNIECSFFWFDFLYCVLLYMNGLGINLEVYYFYDRQ